MRYLHAALGTARCPIAIDQVFAGKIAIISLDLLHRYQSRERLRRPWMSGVSGARSRPLAGKTPRRWVPYCGFGPDRRRHDPRRDLRRATNEMISQRRLKPNFRGPDGQRPRSILPRGLCAAAGPLLMFKTGQPVFWETSRDSSVGIQTICCRLAVRKLPACCKKTGGHQI
jgi:hypothetical protein